MKTNAIKSLYVNYGISVDMMWTCSSIFLNSNLTQSFVNPLWWLTPATHPPRSITLAPYLLSPLKHQTVNLPIIGQEWKRQWVSLEMEIVSAFISDFLQTAATVNCCLITATITITVILATAEITVNGTVCGLTGFIERISLSVATYPWNLIVIHLK